MEEKETLVLDATFYLKSIRELFRKKAEESGFYLEFIEVQAHPELIRERLEKSREFSDANFQVYLKIKEEFEDFDKEHLVLTSRQNNGLDLLNKTLRYVRKT